MITFNVRLKVNYSVKITYFVANIFLLLDLKHKPKLKETDKYGISGLLKFYQWYCISNKIL